MGMHNNFLVDMIKVNQITKNLIKQIEVNDYKDNRGFPLKSNPYYVLLKEVIQGESNISTINI